MLGVHFSPEQYERLREFMGSPMRRLLNLRARLERAGAVPGDPLYDATSRAIDEVHRVMVEMHYRSCRTGVGPRGERGSV